MFRNVKHANHVLCVFRFYFDFNIVVFVRVDQYKKRFHVFVINEQ